MVNDYLIGLSPLAREHEDRDWTINALTGLSPLAQEHPVTTYYVVSCGLSLA
ncbi:hypothetical protein KCP75_15400 [Salmonella enterica subsp. enterica]|nr:hypothetical protein KCP75_15400 [Salmonella enterica subsp. enterica]